MMWRFFQATTSAFPGNWDGNNNGYGYRMMGPFGTSYANSLFDWFIGVVWLSTWVLVIIALIALIRWLWKKGN